MEEKMNKKKLDIIKKKANEEKNSTKICRNDLYDG